MYPLPSGRSVLVRRIHRVSIDTIRLSSDLLVRFNSASIASKTQSTSRIEAYIPVPSTRNFDRSIVVLGDLFAMPSAMLRGMGWAARNH